MPTQDYYAILGVAPDADVTQIKRAYRRLALECHPDRFPDDEAAAKRFRQVSQAYDVLSDPQKRAQYDRGSWSEELSELAANPSLTMAKDLFRSVLGDVFGTQKKERRRGRDVRYTLSLSLRDAVLGSRQRISFVALSTCEHCDGHGFAPGGAPPAQCDICQGAGELKRKGFFGRKSRCGRCDGTGMIQVDACPQCKGRGSLRAPREFMVDIPPGTEAGSERCIAGQGEPGRFGGEAGQLRITIRIRPDEHLRRDGRNLRCDLPVHPLWLALGKEIWVPTLEGHASLRIPAGVQSGASLRMKGLGVPDGRGERGDLLIRLLAETPVALGEDQARQIEALEKLLGADNLPKTYAFQAQAAQRAQAADSDQASQERVKKSPSSQEQV